jgi:hypothetical protein
MAATRAKTKKTTKRRTTARRELVDTGRDKRYVRRDGSGQFQESDDQGRSLARDRAQRSQRTAKSGQGDRGDRR